MITQKLNWRTAKNRPSEVPEELQRLLAEAGEAERNFVFSSRRMTASLERCLRPSAKPGLSANLRAAVEKDAQAQMDAFSAATLSYSRLAQAALFKSTLHNENRQYTNQSAEPCGGQTVIDLKTNQEAAKKLRDTENKALQLQSKCEERKNLIRKLWTASQKSRHDAAARLGRSVDFLSRVFDALSAAENRLESAGERLVCGSQKALAQARSVAEGLRTALRAKDAELHRLRALAERNRSASKSKAARVVCASQISELRLGLSSLAKEVSIATENTRESITRQILDFASKAQEATRKTSFTLLENKKLKNTLAESVKDRERLKQTVAQLEKQKHSAQKSRDNALRSVPLLKSHLENFREELSELQRVQNESGDRFAIELNKTRELLHRNFEGIREKKEKSSSKVGQNEARLRSAIQEMTGEVRKIQIKSSDEMQIIRRQILELKDVSVDVKFSLEKTSDLLSDREAQIAEKDKMIALKNIQISEKEALVAEKEALIVEQENLIDEKNALILRFETELKEKTSQLIDKEEVISENVERLKDKEEEIVAKNTQLIEIEVLLGEKETQIQEKESQIAEKEDELSVKEARIKEKETQIAEKESQIIEKESQIKAKEAQIIEKDYQIQEMESQMAGKDSQIQERESQIVEKESEIAEKQAQIAEKEAEIEDQKAQLQKKEILLTEMEAQIVELDDQLTEKTAQLKDQNPILLEKDAQLKIQESALAEKTTEISAQISLIANQTTQLSEKQTLISDQEKRISEITTQLDEKEAKISEITLQLEEKEVELSTQKSLLAEINQKMEASEKAAVLGHSELLKAKQKISDKKLHFEQMFGNYSLLHKIVNEGTHNIKAKLGSITENHSEISLFVSGSLKDIRRQISQVRKVAWQKRPEVFQSLLARIEAQNEKIDSILPACDRLSKIATLVDSLKNHLKGSKKELTEFEEECGKLNEKLIRLQAQLEDENREKARLIAEHQAEIEQRGKIQESLAVEKEKIKESLATEKEKIEKLEEQTKDLNRLGEEKTLEAANLAAEVERLNEEAKVASEEVQRLTEEVKKTSDEIQRLNEESKKVSDEALQVHEKDLEEITNLKNNAEELREELKEKEECLKISKEEVNSLSVAQELATETIKKQEEELRSTKATLSSKEEQSASETQKILSLESQLEKLRESLKETNEKLVIVQAESQKKTLEIDLLEQKTELRVAEVEKLKNDLSFSRKKAETLEGELKDSITEGVAASKKIEELTTQLSQSEEKRSNLLNELAELRGQIVDLLDQLEGAKTVGEQTARELAQMEKKATHSQRECAQLSERVRLVEESRAGFSERAERKASELHELHKTSMGENSALKNKNLALTQELSRAQAELESLRSQLEKSRPPSRNAEKLIKRKSSEVGRLIGSGVDLQLIQSSISNLEGDIKVLEEQNDSIRARDRRIAEGQMALSDVALERNDTKIRLAKLKKAHSKLVKSLEEKDQAVEKAQLAHEATKEELSKATLLNAEISEELTIIREKLAKAEASALSSSQQVTELQAELKQLHAQKLELEKDAAKSSQDIGKLKEQLSQQELQLKDLKEDSEVAKLKNEMQELKNELEEMNEAFASKEDELINTRTELIEAKRSANELDFEELRKLLEAYKDEKEQARAQANEAKAEAESLRYRVSIAETEKLEKKSPEAFATTFLRLKETVSGLKKEMTCLAETEVTLISKYFQHLLTFVRKQTLGQTSEIKTLRDLFESADSERKRLEIKVASLAEEKAAIERKEAALEETKARTAEEVASILEEKKQLEEKMKELSAERVGLLKKVEHLEGMKLIPEETQNELAKARATANELLQLKTKLIAKTNDLTVQLDESQKSEALLIEQVRELQEAIGRLQSDGGDDDERPSSEKSDDVRTLSARLAEAEKSLRVLGEQVTHGRKFQTIDEALGLRKLSRENANLLVSVQRLLEEQRGLKEKLGTKSGSSSARRGRMLANFRVFYFPKGQKFQEESELLHSADLDPPILPAIQLVPLAKALLRHSQVTLKSFLIQIKVRSLEKQVESMKEELDLVSRRLIETQVALGNEADEGRAPYRASVGNMYSRVLKNPEEFPVSFHDDSFEQQIPNFFEDHPEASIITGQILQSRSVELQKTQAKLVELRSQLEQRELELATTRATLHRLEESNAGVSSHDGAMTRAHIRASLTQYLIQFLKGSKDAKVLLEILATHLDLNHGDKETFFSYWTAMEPKKKLAAKLFGN